MVEERQETCSIASKIVRIKIFRRSIDGALNAGEIVGFECGSKSSTCESRCSYKLLLEDY